MSTLEEPADGFDWDTAGEWNVWFAVNAALPFVFAFSGLLGGGHLGFLVALSLIWFVGFQLAGCRSDVGRSLVWGAAWVAAMQFVPALQLTACVAAEFAVAPLRKSVFDDSTLAGRQVLGFLATLLAAQPLLGVATLIGYWRRWVWNDLRPRSDTDPDADP
jgi:hypothetical protein